MEKSSLFAALSFVAVWIYLHIGTYSLRQNAKSRVHITFFCLCLSYAIWSFAYAFAYLSIDAAAFSFWNKVSAVGWCSFSFLSLFLTLQIKESPILKSRLIKILIFLPAAVFFLIAVFLFGPNMQTPQMISDIFYIGNFIYNFTFLLLSILILLFWGLRSDSPRVKHQSRLLAATSLTAFILNLLTQSILPLVGIHDFPLMGQLYSVIMILGAYRVITKYKFLKLPENIILEEVSKKMMDLVIIINEKGHIIKISHRALDMLGYCEEDILNQNIRRLAVPLQGAQTLLEIDLQEREYDDIPLLRKDGQALPVHVSYIPILDSQIHDFLGAVLIIQDTRLLYELKSKNRELERQVVRDSLTNLYNHQYSMELVSREISRVCDGSAQAALSVLMIDIDFFKNLNDTYGHLFGDGVIKTISAMMNELFDDFGYVGRFGGEEFIVILPGAKLEHAFCCGERIRKKIESYPFENNVKVTISIGANQYTGQPAPLFIQSCDDLLYYAKNSGRNRTECRPSF